MNLCALLFSVLLPRGPFEAVTPMKDGVIQECYSLLVIPTAVEREESGWWRD
jgi:hypothetical protein